MRSAPLSLEWISVQGIDLHAQFLLHSPQTSAKRPPGL